MKLLVSVTDAAEARPAVAGGVDVVDVKNPAEGSLGAPAPGVIAQVRACSPGGAAAQRRDRRPALRCRAPPRSPRSARRAAGAAYVKVGLWGAVDRRSEAVAVLRAARDAVGGERGGGRRRLRRRRARAEPAAGAAELVAAARRAGVSGCLLDTAIKDGRGLLSWLDAGALAGLVAEAHGAGLEIALAGELRARGPAGGSRDRRRHRRRALGRLPRRAAHGGPRPGAHRAAAGPVRRGGAARAGLSATTPAGGGARRARRGMAAGPAEWNLGAWHFNPSAPAAERLSRLLSRRRGAARRAPHRRARLWRASQP